VPPANDRECLEPAQPDLDLDLHDGFSFSASARSADARRVWGRGGRPTAKSSPG
jgi:hypothetical protein